MKQYISLDSDDGQAKIDFIPKKKKMYPKDKNSSWYYLGMVGQIGFTIAIPIAGGALLGSYIDKKFGSYPKATILLLFLGIVVSMINFYTTIKAIMDKKI